MIVDYNYKPHVVNPAPGITSYVPAAKNNKGFIILIGLDDLAQSYAPTVNTVATDGTLLQIPFSPLNNTSGSFFDTYLQFKRETTAATTVVKTADLCMVPYSAESFLNTAPTPLFFPTTFVSLTFDAVLSAPSSWTRPLTIITLY